MDQVGADQLLSRGTWKFRLIAGPPRVQIALPSPTGPTVPREEGSVEAEVMVCNDLLCPVCVLPLALTKLSAS